MDNADLILLPGTLCDERVFAQATLGIASTTLPIHGADNAPDMALRILAAAPRRFALCGFSLGAIVALEVIAQAPERVTRLALLGGNARAMPPDRAATRRDAVTRAEREGTVSFIDAAWDASVPAARRDDAGLREELEAMARAATLADFRDQIEIAINRNDMRPRLRDIAVPTLILCGAEDRICPPELSREMAEAIPAARLVIVENAGHYVSLDQPAVVARQLRDWLAEPTDHRTLRVSKELS